MTRPNRTAAILGDYLTALMIRNLPRESPRLCLLRPPGTRSGSLLPWREYPHAKGERRTLTAEAQALGEYAEAILASDARRLKEYGMTVPCDLHGVAAVFDTSLWAVDFVTAMYKFSATYACGVELVPTKKELDVIDRHLFTAIGRLFGAMEEAHLKVCKKCSGSMAGA